MEMKNIQIPEKKRRTFLPENFEVRNWEEIKPFYDELINREIPDKEALKEWFKDRSELESVLSEDLGWRYIHMTRDTTDEDLRKKFNFFIEEIEPKIAPLSHKLNEKAINSPYLEEIKDPAYKVMIRSLKKAYEIFREENIPLHTQVQKKSQQYGQLSGSMTVRVDGEEITLQQAGVFLQSTDRSKREEVFKKINERRDQDKDKLDQLFTDLVRLRDRIGRNADFKNYRDYKFAELGRFDYKPEDCFDFHESVKSEMVPVLNELAERRKDALNLDTLRPWDKAVDVTGKEPLLPFNSSADLIDKTIQCFERLDPFLGQCLAIMKKMGHLDLESRKGKAPGGYNYPLAEIGVPFIFMNATSTLRDMITILHEGGHAVHSFLTRDLELNQFKNTPSEVAELASMSMELLTMDHWDIYFEEPEDLNRAKREHLEQIIQTLPWIATIDKFQHWIYENPDHSEKDRILQWNKIFDEFTDNVTDWSEFQNYKDYIWQKQLHLYEVPFYYIEYGMAQLGAVAIWKNFREDPQRGLRGYMNALKLGYTRTIPEVYAASGIKFDFSKDYINDLTQFIRSELEKIS